MADDASGFSAEQEQVIAALIDAVVPPSDDGRLPGAGELHGVAGLEDALLKRPELFAGTLTEKLLTFALGRGVEYYDAPAVRRIVGDAAKDGYRFSSLILGIVKSTPFQLRNSS